jgi:hypothetical protein
LALNIHPLTVLGMSMPLYLIKNAVCAIVMAATQAFAPRDLKPKPFMMPIRFG